MPTYEYECEACKFYFTKILSMSSMHAPEAIPCPDCQAMRVKKVMMTPAELGDSVRLRIRRPDEGFKDVLRKIHDSTPGSTLKNNSSYI